VPLPAAGSQAAQTNTGRKRRADEDPRQWIPEGVQAAVEEDREVAAAGQELLAGRGVCWKQPCLPCRCLTRGLAWQRQEASPGYLSHSRSWAPSAPW